MTSVNAGQSAGTALGSYLDSLSKSPSGAASTSGNRQSGGTDGTTSDTTSPASVVSLSPRAKAMLAQAKDAQAALKTLKDAASKNDTSARKGSISRLENTTGTVDPAGDIFKLITHGGETVGFIASAPKSGSDTPAGTNVEANLIINQSGKGGNSGSFIDAVQNMVKKYPVTGGMSESYQDSFTSALNNGTLTVMHPEDVPGLNYKVSIGHTEGGMTMSSSFNMIKPAPGTTYVVGWAENVGSYYLSWPVSDSNQGNSSAAVSAQPSKG